MPAIAGHGKRRRQKTDNDYVFAHPTFDDATEELLRHFELQEPPEIVRSRAVDVFENPTKLFCWVGDAGLAPGTTRVEPGLYASNLFVELLVASRALDWERVAIILEQAKSPVP